MLRQLAPGSKVGGATAQAKEGLGKAARGNTGHFVAMVSQSRTFPLLMAAACCMTLLRSFWAPRPRAFVAPYTSGHLSVHSGCRASSGGALAAGNVPAVVKGVRARPAVPAHYKVTLETPDGPMTFEPR